MQINRYTFCSTIIFSTENIYMLIQGAENSLSWKLCSELGFLLPDRASVYLHLRRQIASHHTCLHRLDKREVLMATLVVGAKQSMCWRITSGKLLILSAAPLTFLSSLILVSILFLGHSFSIYIGLKKNVIQFPLSQFLQILRLKCYWASDKLLCQWPVSSAGVILL